MKNQLPAPAVETGEFGLQLRDIDEMWRFANMVSESGLAPKSLSNPKQIIVALQHGMEVGLKPLQALNSIAVINGKPSIYGDAGTALVMASGLLERKDEEVRGEGDKRTATCVLWRKGIEQPFVGSFSVAQAKQAKLWGKAGPWQQYPERMLMWRARTYAYRDGFADCLCGLTFYEESRDIEPAREVKDEGRAVDIDAILEPKKSGTVTGIPDVTETVTIDYNDGESVEGEDTQATPTTIEEIDF